MPSPSALAAYEAFRVQARSNPALADAWGEAGTASAGTVRPERVLTILERRGVGASNTAFHVIRGLRERGFVYHHTLVYGDPGAIGSLAAHTGFDAALEAPTPKESWSALYRLLAHSVDAFTADLIIAQRELPWSWMLAELRRERPGLRSIVVCNGGPLLFRVMDTPLEGELGAALRNGADLVVVPSKFVRAHVLTRLRLDPQRVVMIRGGYDPAIFHARERVADDGPLRVTFVGRLEPDKAPDRFLGAVLESGVALRATVIGDGRMRAELEAEARRAKPDQSLVFAGSLGAGDVAARLRQTDVLVVPSRTEGLGIQVLEGMASGVAVVAMRVGGLVELVGESGAGRLVDSTAEMAAALRELAHDRALAQRLGAAGPGFVVRERLDWGAVASQWEQMIDRLATRRLAAARA